MKILERLLNEAEMTVAPSVYEVYEDQDGNQWVFKPGEGFLLHTDDYDDDYGDDGNEWDDENNLPNDHLKRTMKSNSKKKRKQDNDDIDNDDIDNDDDNDINSDDDDDGKKGKKGKKDKSKDDEDDEGEYGEDDDDSNVIHGDIVEENGKQYFVRQDGSRIEIESED